jgi:hypothetical protein
VRVPSHGLRFRNRPQPSSARPARDVSILWINNTSLRSRRGARPCVRSSPRGPFRPARYRGLDGSRRPSPLDRVAERRRAAAIAATTATPSPGRVPSRRAISAIDSCSVRACRSRDLNGDDDATVARATRGIGVGGRGLSLAVAVGADAARGDVRVLDEPALDRCGPSRGQPLVVGRRAVGVSVALDPERTARITAGDRGRDLAQRARGAITDRRAIGSEQDVGADPVGGAAVATQDADAALAQLAERRAPKLSQRAGTRKPGATTPASVAPETTTAGMQSPLRHTGRR